MKGDRLVPVLDDVDTAPFFDAARRHELVVQVCNGCGALLHLPRAYCAECGSWDSRWQVTSGRGRVYSWTVVEHQVHPSMPVPYTIVLVELDDYPAARFVGKIAGAVDLTAGQVVHAEFEELEPGIVLPRWVLA